MRYELNDELKIKQKILNELANRDSKNAQIYGTQMEKIMQKYSNTIKSEVLAEIINLDVKNTQITNIQWYMTAGLGVILAAPSFINKQNPAIAWWIPVFMFLTRYFFHIPGLELFYKKYFNKHKKA